MQFRSAVTHATRIAVGALMALLAAAGAARALTQVIIDLPTGNTTARTINFPGTTPGFSADFTAYDLRVTNAAPTSSFGTFEVISSDPFTPDANLDIFAFVGEPGDNNCDGTGGCGPANQMNQHPAHHLGLDGSQAQNFIGYGEAVEVQFNGDGQDDYIQSIDSITIYEKKSAVDKHLYIFDSFFQFRGLITIAADNSNASGGLRTYTPGQNNAAGVFTIFNNGTQTFGDRFYIVGGDESGNANDAFTLASITLTATIPLPASVWMLLGGVGLLGWVGRRRRAA